MTTDTATRATEEIHRDENRALNFHLVQELGVDPREKPSAWVAAGSSFVMFAIGAIIPLIPYLLGFESLWAGLICGGVGSAHRRRGRRPVHQQAAVVGGVAAAGIWRDRDHRDVCRRHSRRHGDHLSYMLRRLLLACCLTLTACGAADTTTTVSGLRVPGSDAGVARRDAGRHGHRRPVGHQLRPASQLYYIISDDRSAKNPARFYTARISLSANGIDDVEFVSTHPWLDTSGKPFRPLDVDAQPPVIPPDPEGIAVDPGASACTGPARVSVRPKTSTGQRCWTPGSASPGWTAAIAASSSCRRCWTCRPSSPGHAATMGWRAWR